MLKRDAAIHLSTGQFDEASEFLSKEVKWNIINDQELNGYNEVQAHFKQINQYFNSVVTHFEVHDVIETTDRIVVIGTAEFYKENKILNIIEACDIYWFEADKIVELKSYCIPLDNNRIE